jgi:hypothetical protein
MEEYVTFGLQSGPGTLIFFKIPGRRPSRGLSEEIYQNLQFTGRFLCNLPTMCKIYRQFQCLNLDTTIVPFGKKIMVMPLF